MKSKNLIIIPTYNEIDNIEKLINAVRNEEISYDILVVDDNSPDGTANKVSNIMQKDEHVFLIKRAGKLGIGSAYIEGFRYAIENNYDIIFQMDSDFSHDPIFLKDFMREIETNDLVIGSRYINGISIINWDLKRLILSMWANFYVRTITRLKFRDCTSGFKCFRVETLKQININNIKSDSYSFQVEVVFRANKLNKKIKEVPIVFKDRVRGISKMSSSVIFESAIRPFLLHIMK